MSNGTPSIEDPEFPALSTMATTTQKVLHEPPHWHHHTMTEVISSAPAVLPHPSNHHHHQHHHTDSHPHSTLSYTIRPGTQTDLDAIHKIYTYYVLNSAISLLVHAPDIDYLKKGYHASMARNMPYLVAISTHANMTPASATDDFASSEEKTTDATSFPELNQNTSAQIVGEVEVILGYAHLVPLSEKAGYGPTTELTMYVHPSYLNFGIGSALMSALETKLRDTPILVFEQGFEDKGTERFADVILARVGDDVERDFEGVRVGDGGEWPVWKAQREKNTLWYRRKGFEEVGRMKGVGEKFGKRTDVIILQKTLGPP